jgi:hypothetical protein
VRSWNLRLRVTNTGGDDYESPLIPFEAPYDVSRSTLPTSGRDFAAGDEPQPPPMQILDAGEGHTAPSRTTVSASSASSGGVLQLALFYSTSMISSRGIWASLQAEIDKMQEMTSVGFVLNAQIAHNCTSFEVLKTKLLKLQGKRAGNNAPLVLQFIGHGEQGQMMFAGADDFDQDMLASLIAACRPTCVVFNACSTYDIARAVCDECQERRIQWDARPVGFPPPDTTVCFWQTPVNNAACEQLSTATFAYMGELEGELSAATFFGGISEVWRSCIVKMFPCVRSAPQLGMLPTELNPVVCKCAQCRSETAAEVTPAVSTRQAELLGSDVVSTAEEPSLGTGALDGGSPAVTVPASHDDFPVIVDEESMVLLSTDMANTMRGRPLFTVFDKEQMEQVEGDFTHADWVNFLDNFNDGFVKLWHGRYFECGPGPSREFWFQVDRTRRFHCMGNVDKLVVLHVHYIHGSADLVRVTHVNARWSIPPDLQKLSHYRPMMRRSIQEGGLCITGTCKLLYSVCSITVLSLPGLLCVCVNLWRVARYYSLQYYSGYYVAHMNLRLPTRQVDVRRASPLAAWARHGASSSTSSTFGRFWTTSIHRSPPVQQ